MEFIHNAETDEGRRLQEIIHNRFRRVQQDLVSTEFDLLPPFPKEVLIDPTSFCNHRCVFCANPAMKIKNELNLERARSFLQQAYKGGSRYTGFFGTGEPFLLKNLDEYVAAAADIGFEYIYIKSNGALAKEDRLAKVFRAGLNSLRFSISASNPESYKKIQGRDDFEVVRRNLETAARLRSELNIPVELVVTMVVNKLNESELNELHDQVRPFIDIWDPHIINSQCGDMPANSDIGLPTGLSCPKFNREKGVCEQPFKSFSITPEGFVSACFMDFSHKLIVNEQQETDLQAVWQSEVYKEFRADHLSGNLENTKCFNCVNSKNEAFVSLFEKYKQSKKSG